MKKVVVIVSFLLLSISFGFPNENRYSGARALALSNASVTLGDLWSNVNNQAGLAFLESFSAGIYFESRFLVEELELISGATVIPVKSGVFGVNFSQFGQGTFKELKTGLAFSKKLTEKWSAGIQFDYFAQTIPENQRAESLFTFEGGVIYSVSKDLCLGVHIFNPVLQGYETPFGKIQMPGIFRVGGHYNFSKLVFLAFELQKNTEIPVLLKTGVEFTPVKNLSLRCGISGKPMNFTSGMGYTFKKITTDFAFSYHQNLGITPSVSIQFKLK